MNCISKNFFILIFSVFLLNDLKAETPHFVDFRFILNESIAGKKAQGELKNKLEKGINQLRSKEKKIQEEEKKLIQQKKLMKPDEYKKKVDELRTKVSKLQKERKDLLEDIAKKRSKARAELLKNLNPLMENYMKDKNIRMILDKKELIVADKKLDITKDIIELLNKKLKSIKVD
jgi:outer membrane protein